MNFNYLILLVIDYGMILAYLESAPENNTKEVHYEIIKRFRNNFDGCGGCYYFRGSDGGRNIGV